MNVQGGDLDDEDPTDENDVDEDTDEDSPAGDDDDPDDDEAAFADAQQRRDWQALIALRGETNGFARLKRR